MAAQDKVTFKQDLTEPVKIRHYEGVAFTGDDCGNLIKVALFDGGTPYSGGGTVSATAVLADGTTFPLTHGSITGNMVSVPLEAGALVVSGLMGLYVKISGGGIICTVLNAIFTVQVTDTGRVPTATVTTVAELVQDIKDAQDSFPADLTNLLAAVAPTFSTSTAYSAGAYVWQGGRLYRFTAAHPAGTWTGTDAAEVALGNDVADLKSALKPYITDYPIIFHGDEITVTQGEQPVQSGKRILLDGTIGDSSAYTIWSINMSDQYAYKLTVHPGGDYKLIRFIQLEDYDGNVVAYIKADESKMYTKYIYGFNGVCRVSYRNYYTRAINKYNTHLSNAMATAESADTSLNNVFTLENYTWTIGSMQSGSGNDTPDDKRIRSEYIAVQGGEVVNVSGNPKCLIVYCFDTDGTYISDSAWDSGNVFNVPSGTGYIRILLRKSASNEVIAESDIAAQVARCTLKRVLPHEAYSADEIENGLSNISASSWTRQELFWTSGSISKETGAEINSTTRIRTGYISVNNAVRIKLSVSVGYRFVVDYYDSSKSPLTNIPLHGEWITAAELEYPILSSVAYVRLLLSIDNSTEILPSAGDNATLTMASKIIDNIGLYEIASYNGIGNAFAIMKNFEASVPGQRNLKSLPSFVHVSDAHDDAVRFERAVIAAKCLGVDSIAATGDFVDSPDDYFGFVTDSAEKYGVTVLPCIGNHEATDKTAQYVSEKFIQPFSDDITLPTGVSNPTYYYKDYTGKAIRIISVNQYEAQTDGVNNNRIHFSQEQITWFANTLLNTPTDYGVIIIMHSPEKTPVLDSDYPKFKQPVLYYTAPMNDNPITEIVDAFISGISITKTFNNETGSVPETVSVNADFSQKNSGVEFIAYMTGHLHSDNISYVPGTNNKQLMLNIVCANAWTNRLSNLVPGAGYAFFNELNDLGRAEEGPNQDAMNVYVIDRTHKCMRIARIGADQPYTLATKRDYMIIPYTDI